MAKDKVDLFWTTLWAVKDQPAWSIFTEAAQKGIVQALLNTDDAP